MPGLCDAWTVWWLRVWRQVAEAGVSILTVVPVTDNGSCAGCLGFNSDCGTSDRQWELCWMSGVQFRLQYQ